MQLPVTLPDNPAEAAACCVQHRRLIQWIPAPGWWIHYPDCRTCRGCWGASDPLGRYDWLPNLPGYAGYSITRERS
jgi:hypothetical protein